MEGKEKQWNEEKKYVQKRIEALEILNVVERRSRGRRGQIT